MKGRPVTIRTLDLGADKMASYHQGTGPGGRDSVLGLRSLRLSLRDPALFRTQLRAILRAGTLGDVRVLFPLVSTLGEFRQARAVLDDVASELNAEGVAVRADLPVGVMVEVPAAAVMADHFAKEVDFFSIGTNDLIQYTLAVDRTDETVAEPLARPTRRAPADRHGGRRGGARNMEVSVCGTMGGEPLFAMLLMGLGLRNLSMPPHQLPEIKRVIRGISAEDARTVAAEALRQETSQAVVRLLDDALRRALPDTPAPITRGRDG
ncbi:MAG: putative PEP-binding protein [Singulisphaera sp.]